MAQGIKSRHEVTLRTKESQVACACGFRTGFAYTRNSRELPPEPPCISIKQQLLSNEDELLSIPLTRKPFASRTRASESEMEFAHSCECSIVNSSNDKVMVQETSYLIRAPCRTSITSEDRESKNDGVNNALLPSSSSRSREKHVSSKAKSKEKWGTMHDCDAETAGKMDGCTIECTSFGDKSSAGCFCPSQEVENHSPILKPKTFSFIIPTGLLEANPLSARTHCLPRSSLSAQLARACNPVKPSVKVHRANKNLRPKSACAVLQPTLINFVDMRTLIGETPRELGWRAKETFGYIANLVKKQKQTVREKNKVSRASATGVPRGLTALMNTPCENGELTSETSHSRERRKSVAITMPQALLETTSNVTSPTSSTAANCECSVQADEGIDSDSITSSNLPEAKHSNTASNFHPAETRHTRQDTSPVSIVSNFPVSKPHGAVYDKSVRQHLTWSTEIVLGQEDLPIQDSNGNTFVKERDGENVLFTWKRIGYVESPQIYVAQARTFETSIKYEGPLNLPNRTHEEEKLVSPTEAICDLSSSKDLKTMPAECPKKTVARKRQSYMSPNQGSLISRVNIDADIHFQTSASGSPVPLPMKKSEPRRRQVSLQRSLSCDAIKKSAQPKLAIDAMCRAYSMEHDKMVLEPLSLDSRKRQNKCALIDFEKMRIDLPKALQKPNNLSIQDCRNSALSLTRIKSGFRPTSCCDPSRLKHHINAKTGHRQQRSKGVQQSRPKSANDGFSYLAKCKTREPIRRSRIIELWK